MQNLALTSQFGNNGRRGNSSSNSFNSLVLNGVLPPSEDGRVEGIQFLGELWRNIQAWWEGRNSGPDDLFDKNNPGSGGGTNTIGPFGGSIFGDRNFGSQPDLTGGSGKGGGGDNDDRENWDPHNYGGTIRINYPTPNSGYFFPSDWYWEQKARDDYYNRVLTNVMTFFENPGFQNEIFNTLKNNLVSLFNQLFTNTNNNIMQRVLENFLGQILDKLLNPDNNLIEKVKEYIKSGKFSANSGVPDWQKLNELNADREKVYFTLFQQLFESEGVIIESPLGILRSITINMKIEVKDGKTYLKIYGSFVFRKGGEVYPPKDIPLYEVRIY